jgi:hypothetical protein
VNTAASFNFAGKCRRGISRSARNEAFLFPLALATVLRGYSLAQQGNTSEGIAQIREGIAAYRATGAELETQYWFALLAKACAKKARLDKSSRALDEALSHPMWGIY